ncbi:MAG: dephospho-CoA kinase [Clostridia bacterium]
MIIGITGQTGTGKSTLAGIFKKNGYKVFDADKEYADLMNNDLSLKSELIDHFGSDKRQVILNAVMDDSEQLEKLNAITHKYVVKKIYEFVSRNSGEDIILDVPVPVSKGFLDITDTVIITVCDREIQLKRLSDRYFISHEDAVKRINMQMKYTEYVKLGRCILNTSYTDSNDLDAFCRIFVNTCLTDKMN